MLDKELKFWIKQCLLKTELTKSRQFINFVIDNREYIFSKKAEKKFRKLQQEVRKELGL